MEIFVENEHYKDVKFNLQHSQKRIQQRTTMKNINVLITFADRVIPVKNGCVSLSVSKSKLQSIVQKGQCNPQIADKISNLAAVVANDNEVLEVVTVLHMKNDIRGRHHRKNIKLSYRRTPKNSFSRTQK